jgi:hypothetical protein
MATALIEEQRLAAGYFAFSPRMQATWASAQRGLREALIPLKGRNRFSGLTQYRPPSRMARLS